MHLVEMISRNCRHSAMGVVPSCGLGAGAACIACFPAQPLGDFRVKDVMKLDIVLIQRAPCSLPTTELDLFPVQAVVIEDATGKSETKRWHVGHKCWMGLHRSAVVILFARLGWNLAGPFANGTYLSILEAGTAAHGAPQDSFFVRLRHFVGVSEGVYQQSG